ncbi:MAG: 6-carboxytetrahydropterin synthase QueD [Proteobacteria bacterium]|nr:6-carboxytetrahydropterin synthase QueD [Pseudomonadota bacterium]
MYEIRITSKFNAAHNLRNYNGKCEKLHGHTWKVEVCIEGSKLNETGFLYDFRVIKGATKEVLERFDHAYINEISPFDKINPTAENLASVIYEELKKQFPQLKEVTVWESEDASATYRVS